MADDVYVGAIDQGTTGTRFMVFNRAGVPVGHAYREHSQIYPRPGWVEHDAREIWRNALAVVSEALSNVGIKPARLAAIGVTNQRETAVVWDRRTGEPVCNAIVWQDRRTADRCRELERNGVADLLVRKTGLPPDPYFSATKLEWLLQNVPGLREQAQSGNVLAGTVDAWLIWKMTGRHVTDATNASRTMLFNLHEMRWDDELLELFGVPRALLPEVRPSSEVYGTFALDGMPVPVAGDLGDQQAALFGQACFSSGDTKNTYGTGAFLLRNTGERPVTSRNGLLTTVAYHLPGRPACYALEGSVFIAGAAVQWLRDGLRMIRSARETQELAESVAGTDGVYFVPAFTGLGAPYWNSYARGTIVGLTRGTGAAHVARATLEAIAYQARDVIDAMAADAATSSGAGERATPQHALRVDGGAVANDFLCQFQSDVLGVPVVRPKVRETTALGAAYAAGLAVGYWKGLDEIELLWQADRVFEPMLPEEERERLYAGWKRAVRCALFCAEQETAADGGGPQA
jgi:glycerol kinase